MNRIPLNDDFSMDLDDLIRTRLLIQGNSGSGKSYLLKRICEESHKKIQQIIIDLEGEFAPLRERFDYVLMGPDGDVPVHVKYAKILAQKIMDIGFSAIIDLSELEKADREEFLAKFLKQLLATPEESRRPCLVAIDEAHLFAPQTGEAQSGKAVIDLMTRGRKRGLCGILLTQRISKIHKDATAEVNNKLIGRTFQDVDQKRAASELGFDHSRMLELRELKPGEFYAFGSALSSSVIKIKVGHIRTFHPGPGQIEKFTPPEPGKHIQGILSKLGNIPQDMQDKADAEKAKDEEIRKLRMDLSKAHSARPMPSQEEMSRAIERSILSYKTENEKHMRDLRIACSTWMKEFKGPMERLNKAIEEFSKAAAPFMQEAIEVLNKGKGLFDVPLSAEIATDQRLIVPQIVSRMPKEILERPMYRGESFDNPGHLGGANMKVLEALVSFYPMKMTRSQLAITSGYRPKSGHFNNTLSNLNKSGYLIREDGEYQASESGLAYFGKNRPDPKTPNEIIEMWRSALPKVALKIFDVLLGNPSLPMTREELAEKTEYSCGSGHFNNNISVLTRNKLIKRSGSGYVPNEEIWIIK